MAEVEGPRASRGGPTSAPAPHDHRSGPGVAPEAGQPAAVVELETPSRSDCQGPELLAVLPSGYLVGVELHRANGAGEAGIWVQTKVVPWSRIIDRPLVR
jgi:hypothetical protein